MECIVKEKHSNHIFYLSMSVDQDVETSEGMEHKVQESDINLFSNGSHKGL